MSPFPAVRFPVARAGAMAWGALVFALGGLGACAHRVAPDWVTPAQGVASAPASQTSQDPVPPAWRVAFRDGLLLDPDQATAVFPELGLNPGLAHRVELRASRIHAAGGLLLAEGLVLRCLDRGRVPVEVGICTRVLVGGGSILAVRREDLHVEPPPGAWVAVDRYRLRRVGTVALAQLPENGGGD